MLFVIFLCADEITVSIDDTPYCRLRNGFTEVMVNGRRPPGAAKWKEFGSAMAPFDRAAYVTLGVGVGGFNDFSDEMVRLTPKPWRNDELQGMASFWRGVKDHTQWPGTAAQLRVDYVRVYAL